MCRTFPIIAIVLAITCTGATAVPLHHDSATGSRYLLRTGARQTSDVMNDELESMRRAQEALAATFATSAHAHEALDSTYATSAHAQEALAAIAATTAHLQEASTAPIERAQAHTSAMSEEAEAKIEAATAEVLRLDNLSRFAG